jgi:hypothetical protein
VNTAIGVEREIAIAWPGPVRLGSEPDRLTAVHTGLCGKNRSLVKYVNRLTEAQLVCDSIYGLCSGVSAISCACVK